MNKKLIVGTAVVTVLALPVKSYLKFRKEAIAENTAQKQAIDIAVNRIMTRILKGEYQAGDIQRVTDDLQFEIIAIRNS